MPISQTMWPIRVFHLARARILILLHLCSILGYYPTVHTPMTKDEKRTFCMLRNFPLFPATVNGVLATNLGK